MELERIKLPWPLREMIARRTEWIARDFLWFDRPLRVALANAYLAGMIDAIDVLQTKPAGDGA